MTIRPNYHGSVFKQIWMWLRMGHIHFLPLQQEPFFLKFLEITPWCSIFSAMSVALDNFIGIHSPVSSAYIRKLYQYTFKNFSGMHATVSSNFSTSLQLVDYLLAAATVHMSIALIVRGVASGKKWGALTKKF